MPSETRFTPNATFLLFTTGVSNSIDFTALIVDPVLLIPSLAVRSIVPPL